MPKVSVVLPVHMVENYIECCLNSVIAQTFSDIEIILIDDKGNDKSIEIAKQFALKDNRIVIVEHEQNKGLRAAVLTGINVAKSEYVVFVDSDDYVKLNLVETLYNEITKHKVDCVSSGYIEQYEDKAKEIFLNETKVYNKQEIEHDILFPYFEQTENYHDVFANGRWGKIYKVELLKKSFENANIDITVGEDLELNLRFLSLANSIKTLSNYAGYHYRITRQDSMSNRFSFNKLLQQDLLFSEIKLLAIKHKRRGAVVGRELVRSAVNHMNFCINGDNQPQEKERCANKIIDRVNKSGNISLNEKNHLLARLMTEVAKGDLTEKQKVVLLKKLKACLDSKKYLLELSKTQGLTGKMFYILLFFNLDWVVVKIKKRL